MYMAAWLQAEDLGRAAGLAPSSGMAIFRHESVAFGTTCSSATNAQEVDECHYRRSQRPDIRKTVDSTDRNPSPGR
jgi:hypothetical protein